MQRFTFLDRFRIPTYDNPKHMKTASLSFDPDRCIQCGICVSLCPGGCILTDSLTKKDLLQGNPEASKTGIPRLDTLKSGVTLCVACSDCSAACPKGAIHVTQHFNPGLFFRRLTQSPEMRYPKRY